MTRCRDHSRQKRGSAGVYAGLCKGHLLCAAPSPDAPDPVAADGGIGINSLAYPYVVVCLRGTLLPLPAYAVPGYTSTGNAFPAVNVGHLYERAKAPCLVLVEKSRGESICLPSRSCQAFFSIAHGPQLSWIRTSGWSL